MTQTAKNINNAYLVNENKFIKQAEQLGYQSPHLSDQANILFINSAGKLYRRFIVGFQMVQHSNIFQSQIRQNVVDKDYCREHLIPRIKKDGGILDPIWVNKRTNTTVELEHGHHREHSNKVIHQGQKPMPCFILSDFVIELDNNGHLTNNKIQHKFFLIKSKIGCNPPANNLVYKFMDVPHQLRDLFNADPTFNGLNPSRQFPERHKDDIFDNIMSDLHPNAFLSQGTRTKIYNLWSKGNSTSKTSNVDFAHITNDLISCGYDSGVTKTSRGTICRKKFLDWYDSNKSVYLGVTNTNAKGATFERDFALPLIKAIADGTIDKKQKCEIVLHCTIYKPPATIVAIKKQRQDFVDLLKTWNTRMTSFGFANIKFKEVIFPKQLTDPNDLRTQQKV